MKRIHKHYGSSLNKLIKPFLKDWISSKEEIESFLFKDFVFAVDNKVLDNNSDWDSLKIYTILSKIKFVFLAYCLRIAYDQMQSLIAEDNAKELESKIFFDFYHFNKDINPIIPRFNIRS